MQIKSQLWILLHPVPTNKEKKFWKSKGINASWKKENVSQLQMRLSGWSLFAFEKNYENKIKTLKQLIN